MTVPTMAGPASSLCTTEVPPSDGGAGLVLVRLGRAPMTWAVEEQPQRLADPRDPGKSWERGTREGRWPSRPPWERSSAQGSASSLPLSLPTAPGRGEPGLSSE